MPAKHQPMKLSRDEEAFLRHWLYDEFHFRAGPGPAKQLQLEHGVISADLGVLVAAGILDQAAAAIGPPDALPTWPWSEDLWHARLAEARATLEAANGIHPSIPDGGQSTRPSV
jgi:hypothetical protein